MEIERKVFVGYNRNSDVVKRSSSGGVFYEITEHLLNNNEKTKIYGCIFDNTLNAIHVGTADKENRDKMCGSKYVISDLNNSYSEVLKDLQNGYNVLFSGTPCQIAGLKTYLTRKRIDFEKLITVDFVCHGVSNKRFFSDYISHMEKLYRSKAVFCNFRAKNKPGKLQDMQIIFENGKKYSASTTKYDWFYSVYLKNLVLINACYSCKYACTNRVSDVTLADAWGITIKGCFSPSLILCNTQKGLDLFEQVKSSFLYEEHRMEDIKNPQLFEASRKPVNYDEFNTIYNEKGFYAAQKYVGNNTILRKFVVKLVDLIYKTPFYKILMKNRL